MSRPGNRVAANGKTSSIAGGDGGSTFKSRKVVWKQFRINSKCNSEFEGVTELGDMEHEHSAVMESVDATQAEVLADLETSCSAAGTLHDAMWCQSDAHIHEQSDSIHQSIAQLKLMQGERRQALERVSMLEGQAIREVMVDQQATGESELDFDMVAAQMEMELEMRMADTHGVTSPLGRSPARKNSFVSGQPSPACVPAAARNKKAKKSISSAR